MNDILRNIGFLSESWINTALMSLAKHVAHRLALQSGNGKKKNSKTGVNRTIHLPAQLKLTVTIKHVISLLFNRQFMF